MRGRHGTAHHDGGVLDRSVLGEDHVTRKAEILGRGGRTRCAEGNLAIGGLAEQRQRRGAEPRPEGTFDGSHAGLVSYLQARDLFGCRPGLDMDVVADRHHRTSERTTCFARASTERDPRDDDEMGQG